MLWNSVVLLVESILPHKMVEKMAKFIKQDSFSRGIISKISTFQGKNGFGTAYSDRIVISQYSLDLANGQYNIPIHIPGIGYFRSTENQTAYLVELEKIAYPLIERILSYFSDLGAEVEYDGLVLKSDGFAQFEFDFLKDDAMLVDHEIDLTLEDFERSQVSGCVKELCNVFNAASNGKAKLLPYNNGHQMYRDELLFVVGFTLSFMHGGTISDITPMRMKLPSIVDGRNFRVGSGFGDIIEAMWEAYGNEDLQRLSYKVKVLTDRKTKNPAIVFIYDANKVFEHISKKYGR